MPEAKSKARYIGWHRPDRISPWTAVVGADDENTCWIRLMGARQDGDKLVQRSTDPSPNIARLSVFRQRRL
jgi:hypothetical protein